MTKEREDVLLKAILEVKGEVGDLRGEVGELRGEVKQVFSLESRVRALEDDRAGRQEASRVRGTFWNHCWELGKLAAAAIFGGFVSHRLFNK